MHKCYHCGKGVLLGRSHTHHRGVAGGRWKKRAPKTQRVFRPNLHKVEIIEDGKKLYVKLCSKCIKRVKKDLRDGVRPFLTLVQHLPQATFQKPPSTVNLRSDATKDPALALKLDSSPSASLH